MAKDKRYTRLSQLISAGKVHSLNDCFDVVAKSVIAEDMKIEWGRFNTKLDDIQKFTFQQFYRFAGQLDVDAELVFRLFDNQYKDQRRKKKKVAQ